MSLLRSSYVCLLLLVDMASPEPRSTVEDVCLAEPPPSNNPYSREDYWFSPDGNPAANSICAGFRAGRHAAGNSKTCSQTIRIDKSSYWRTGLIQYFIQWTPVYRISDASECPIPAPPAMLLQQCSSSLFGCEPRAPYSGWLLWPKLDATGVYVFGGGNKRTDEKISAGVMFGYWWTKRSVPFRLATVGATLGMGDFTASTMASGTAMSFDGSVLRLGVFGSVIQNLVVVEAGLGFVLGASVPSDVERTTPFLRVSLNLADLVNLKPSKTAEQAAESLKTQRGVP